MSARHFAAALALFSSLALAEGPAKREKPADGASKENKDTSMSLNPGDSKSFSVKAISRVSQSDPSVADITFNYKSDDVKVTALREGATTISVWSGTTRIDYQLTVAKK